MDNSKSIYNPNYIFDLFVRIIINLYYRVVFKLEYKVDHQNFSKNNENFRKNACMSLFGWQNSIIVTVYIVSRSYSLINSLSPQM